MSKSTSNHAKHAQELFGLAVRVAMSLLLGFVVLGIFGTGAERNMPGIVDVISKLLTLGAIIVAGVMGWSMYHAFKSQR